METWMRCKNTQVLRWAWSFRRWRRITFRSVEAEVLDSVHAYVGELSAACKIGPRFKWAKSNEYLEAIYGKTFKRCPRLRVGIVCCMRNRFKVQTGNIKCVHRSNLQSKLQQAIPTEHGMSCDNADYRLIEHFETQVSNIPCEISFQYVENQIPNLLLGIILWIIFSMPKMMIDVY